MTLALAEKDVRDGFADITFGLPVSRIITGARRRRVRKRVAFGAVPALGLVAAGGAALLTLDKVYGEAVFCFNSADPKAMPFGAHAPQTSGERAEELCAKEWRAGYLPFEIEDRSKAPYPVPPLTACVVDGESIGVFPTNEPNFCTTGPVARKMQLAEIPEGYEGHIENYIALRAAAAKQVRDAAVAAGGTEKTACLDEGAATSVVEDVLADYDHDDWTIRVEHSKHDAPCWTHINFENDDEEVVMYSTDPGVENIWINDTAAFPNG